MKKKPLPNLLTEDQASIYAAMSEEPSGRKPVLPDSEARASIYAAMMADEEDEEDQAAAEKSTYVPFGSVKSVPIKIAERDYEVATTAYVQQLERTIQKQDATIRKMERAIQNLASANRNHRVAINRSISNAQEMQREIDNKIDGRDR